MPSADTQIKAAYETNGMSPEDIANDLGFEVVAVKAKLAQISSTYRKDAGLEAPDSSRLNFSPDEQETFKKVIYEVALSAEHPDGTVDYRTRLNAAIYGRDDAKGRRDALKNTGAVVNNVFNLNQMIQQARLQASKVRGQIVDADV